MMEEIIDPVSIDLIKAELTEDKKICDTNKAGNEIYVIDAHNSPAIMREVGRLREITFREAGGSSGLSMDIDEFDTMEKPYQQIIIWDPDAQAILGGYRYILGSDVMIKDNGQPHLATAHMFHFSDEFIKYYLPHVIELGRSFVTPEYQSSRAGAKAIFALDNLWDGICAVMMQHPNMVWFFGKMTMYPSYDRSCRDLILHFLAKHFPDPDQLVRPYSPVLTETDPRLMDLLLKDADFKPDYRNLKDTVRRLGSSIPPLVNSYMNTSRTMKVFGTGINDEFSNVEETAILVNFTEMSEDKRDRHLQPYLRSFMDKVKQRFPLADGQIGDMVFRRKEENRMKVFSAFKKKRKG